jgi:formate dehydrogenase subunit gamma
MSNSTVPTHAVQVSPEQAAKDKAFVEERNNSGKDRYIKRHSLQTRLTHGITISCALYLVLSGLFVFVPQLAQSLDSGVVFGIRMSHRFFGVVFVLVPLLSALLAPKGVIHVFKNLFAKWDSDDKKWMILFLPYLFMAKWIHMPDQHEIKSGQRVADGALWFAGALMGVTGVIMLLGTTLFTISGVAYTVVIFLHDIGFFLIAIFGLAHIFLGSGLFQPYRGTHKLMFGDGMVSESDALYHWGHWARKELEKGDNIVEK